MHGVVNSPGQGSEASAPRPMVEQTMDFPGGKVPFTTQLSFSGGRFPVTTPPMPCYQTIDSYGVGLADADVPHGLDEELATRMYRSMVGVQTMDTIFYESQRQVLYF
jgi:2-oxoisovalerate dehydrogenase E1 component alpha subunit